MSTPIVFWLDLISPHLSAFIRALASLPGRDVTVIAQHESLNERTAQGWTVPSVAPAHLVMAKEAEAGGRLMGKAAPNAVHIVGGLRGGALARFAVEEGSRRRLRMGLLSEAADGSGWSGFVRRAIYRAAGLRFGQRFDFVLGMGCYGTKWFGNSGFRVPLFPFAYVTEPVNDSPLPLLQVPEQHLKLLYVGQFIPRKGVDTLLRALSHLRRDNLKLELVGSGTNADQYKQLSNQLGLNHQVSFCGPMPNQSIRLRMKQADCLVLPSRHDGWGAVVNEALQSGTPVICSDRCGAKDLIGDSWRGSVFPAGSVAGLATALQQRSDAGSPSADLRARISQWSTCIGGESLAEYFSAILQHRYGSNPRPIAPWLPISGKRAVPCES